MSEQQAAKIDPASAAIIAELVREMRRPDPAVEAAKAEAEAHRKAGIASLVLEVEQKERSERAIQANCGHTKPSGETAWHRGQIYSDGNYIMMCVRCGKEQKPQPAPREYVTGTGF